MNESAFIAQPIIKTNKAIVDYTSPTLGTPVTPFPADPIFSESGVTE